MVFDAFVIDDIRQFTFPALYARTSKQALEVIEANPNGFKEVFFDHDLGGEDTIYPVVHRLEEMHYYYDEAWPIGKAYIHTANPVGASMLLRALTPLYDCVRINPRKFLVPGLDWSSPNPGTLLGRLHNETEVH